MKSLAQLVNQNVLRDEMSEFLKVSKPKEITSPPVITISRESGSGGRPIAYLVAKKLRGNWRVYYKEIVDRIAKDTNLEEQLVKEVEAEDMTFVHEILDDFFGNKYLTFDDYYQSIVKVITEIGHRGQAIIVGRGANFLLPDALKIRVIADRQQRISWKMKYHKQTHSQAEKEIAYGDRRRNDFIKKLYHRDPREDHHYDLIIKTGPNLSIEEAAELIVKVAKNRFGIK